MESMRRLLSNGTIGLLALATSAMGQPWLSAQGPASLNLAVVDSSGAALSGATVTDGADRVLGRTDASGRLSVTCQLPCRLRLDADGFAEKQVELSAGATIRLEPAAGMEEVM